MKIILLIDFGRGAIKFRGLKGLLRLQDGDILRSLTTKMSCLITITQMSNEMELLTLIDFMQRLQITQKYLFATMDTFNSTLLGETTINFNVMINHREEGMFGDCPVHL